jgi:hypothetical protein
VNWRADLSAVTRLDTTTQQAAVLRHSTHIGFKGESIRILFLCVNEVSALASSLSDD